jgi:hypothetical protein
MPKMPLAGLLFLAVSCTAPADRLETDEEEATSEALPFEFFASFERIPSGNPIMALEPPLWAAATHAIVVDDTVHYYWSRRDEDRRWELMHSTAPVGDPAAITDDPRNPIVVPSKSGFDDTAVEYPFPFLNPFDDQYYMYYRGKGRDLPEQTGLLVSDGDMGVWRRIRDTPVIRAEAEHELDGATHPSVAIEGDTIHIVYTCKATPSYTDGLTMCHATAPTNDPASVTKDPANPVFTGSGAEWDGRAVRETELLRGPEYFHVLYGGFDGEVWRIGHVRTRDFRTFEPNPHNPVFTPSDDPEAWDADGVLTPQVLEIGDRYRMVYAGKKGDEWQTGLATASQP